MLLMRDAGDATRTFDLHDSLFEDALTAPRKNDCLTLCFIERRAELNLLKFVLLPLNEPDGSRHYGFLGNAVSEDEITSLCTQEID